MLSKFLDPKNNVAFLKIFGTEKNKDILIHFLNDVVKFNKGARLKDVTFLKTIQDPEIQAQKTSVVDVLCEDQKGNRYIVEMQVAEEKGFAKRAQYYASKAYSSQLMIKGEYHALKAVIFLAIADFTMFPKKKAFKSDHVILDQQSHENDLKDFSYTFIELPKFTKGIDELSNITEKWVYFFKHAEETTDEDLRKLIDHDQILSRAYEELDRFSWNEDELRAYEEAEKQEGVRIAQFAKKYDDGVAVGEKIGIEKGERIGIEKGEKIGIEKGEKRALLKVAKNLLAKGTKAQEIQRLTGLSKQEVLDLQ